MTVNYLDLISKMLQRAKNNMISKKKRIVINIRKGVDKGKKEHLYAELVYTTQVNSTFRAR